MRPLPTVAEIDELGAGPTVTVPAKYEDLNGHVNVRGHYDLHMDGLDTSFSSRLGIDEAFVERTGQSSFSSTHHVQFHHEILVGHDVTLHLRILGRGAKTIHAVTVLVNRTTGEIASTIEFVEIYVDLTTRRPIEIGPEVAARLDPLLAEHQSLTWTLPPSHQLGTSRPASS